MSPSNHDPDRGRRSRRVRTALRAELDGGPPTGFRPALDGDRVLVSFTNTVVHALRQPGAASKSP